MNASYDESMHELLCAYILGEASGDQIQEVETALAGSAELRAQRLQLEQTIGLVKQGFGESLSLSEGAMSSLLAAASSEPGPKATGSIQPWYASPMLRAAAGILLATGGVLGAKALYGGLATEFGDMSVATGEVNAPTSSRPMDSSGLAPSRDSGGMGSHLDRDALYGLESMGYAGDGGAPTENFAKNQPEASDQGGLGAAPSTPAAGGPTTPGPVSPDVALTKVAKARSQILLADGESDGRGATLEALRALGYSGGEAAVSAESEARDKLGGASAESGRVPERTDAYMHRAISKKGSGPDKDLKESEELAREEVAAVGLISAGRAGGGGGGQGANGAPATPLPATVTAGVADSVRPGSAAPTDSSHFFLGTGATRGRYRGDLAGEELEAKLAEDETVAGYLALYEGREREEPEMLDELRSMGYLGAEAEKLDLGRPDRGRDLRRKLSQQDLSSLADRYAERLYLECRRRPNESPRDMFFRFWGDNPFVATSQDALSTFAADVDTASYALARRYLEVGQLPTKAQIRTEEFVNYAKPDLAPPTEAALAIHTELAPSLFGGKDGRLMLRVGIRGQEIAPADRKPLSLTFAIDVSGSMKEGQRLELVKHAIRLLVGQLHEGDKVGLVAYSREARVVLPMTDASERGLIESALHPLSPNGGTNAEAGLKVAYEMALSALDPSAHSRVILLSDGVANIGTTDQDRINTDVTEHREAGIYLNTIGVGMNNHNDVFLEQLANKGDGICDYVDDEDAARRAIVERFTGALIPIAGDVKIQVQFDPTKVGYYRLLGYENRAVADADFRNDKVDAGEIGAGHQVVALYELDRVPGAEEGPLATVRLRWKAPKVARQHPLEVEVTETSATVNLEDALGSFDEASAGYRRSALTAQLAEFLRRSSHARDDSFRLLDDQTTRLANELGDEDSRELANLVKRSMALGLPLQLLDRSGVDLALEDYRRYLHMRAQLDDLERLQQRLNQQELEQLEQRNDELEQRLRERIYSDLLEKNG